MTLLWQQQVFALDVRCNPYKVKQQPTFRGLYIRRRNQLLREQGEKRDVDQWKQYFQLRSTLLQNKYGITLDQTSLRPHLIPQGKQSGGESVSSWSLSHSESRDGDQLMPTKNAEASRALVGDTSVVDNYSFAGLHHIFDQHTQAVPIVKFANNDRSKLCCVSHDNTLSVCDVLSNPPTVLSVMKQHKQPVTGCDWSAANDLIVSCSLDGQLCLWETRSFTLLRSASDALPNPLHACLFHPVNNNFVVAGSSRGYVEVLNVSTGIKQRNSMGGRVISLSFDCGGHLLWAGNDQGIIVSFSFEMTSGKLRKLRRIYLGEIAAVTSINYREWKSRQARDPSLLVNLSVNSLRLYRVKDKNGSLELKRMYSVRHRSPINHIHSTFCPIMSFREGTCVVTGSEDSNVYFLDVEQDLESKALVNKLQGHSCCVLGCSFNYDESLLATSDIQGLVIIWTRATK